MIDYYFIPGGILKEVNFIANETTGLNADGKTLIG